MDRLYTSVPPLWYWHPGWSSIRRRVFHGIDMGWYAFSVLRLYDDEPMYEVLGDHTRTK